MITNIFPTVCAGDVATTRDFYVHLFGFGICFDSGWYVQLEAPGDPGTQLGIVERTHDSVPPAFRRHPAGVLIAIEVDDVDAVHRRARAAGLPVAAELRTEAFGQRHFMTIDPDGTLVDVITPVPPTAEYVARYTSTVDG